MDDPGTEARSHLSRPPMSMRTGPRTTIALLVGLLVVALTTACTGRGGAAAVAATVGTERISAERIAALTHHYLQTPPGQEFAEKQGKAALARLVLGFQIRLAVLNQAAEDLGVAKATEALPDGMASALMGSAGSKEVFQQAGYSADDLEMAAKGGQLSKAIAARLFPEVPVTEKSLRDQFTARQAEYGQSWKIDAEVAVFPKADSAARFRDLLSQGRAFKAGATSLGAEEAGPVALTPASPLPGPILQVVSSLKEGELSEPITSESKSFIVRVVKRQDVPASTFDEVKPELVEAVTDGKRSELFQKWFKERLRTTKIKVDSHYGKWNPEMEMVA